MAMMYFYSATIIVSTFLFLYALHRRRCCRTPLLIDWPIIGMLPQLLSNLWRIHDYATNVLRQNGGTGEFMGPWFTKMNYMVTCDPININHIMSKRFDNYVKGPEMHEMFQPFGDGLVTADSERIPRYGNTEGLWFNPYSRKRVSRLRLKKTIQNKVRKSLIPILDHACLHGKVLDLQDVFSRLMFDETCLMALGYDPNSLSIEFPLVEAEKAFDEVEESIFYRHIVPRSVWKFQEWLQIGEEKKLTKACKIFDQFLYSHITAKRQELTRSKCNEISDDLLSAMMNVRDKNGKMVHDDKYLRDATFNLFGAGRDTITSGLTWFFWLVATHPLVEAKILEEVEGEKHGILGIENVKKLVYLHGAICEGLRLFPPIPIERKFALKCDTLPSGHQVNPNTSILFFIYAMGRFEEIWGKDCLEFKPERWISKKKKEIIHVPSYKFFSFNTGPRLCLGKDVSLLQMKIVAAAIIRNYHVQVVENHPITPSHSIMLLMKYGLKVVITRRQV